MQYCHSMQYQYSVYESPWLQCGALQRLLTRAQNGSMDLSSST